MPTLSGQTTVTTAGTAVPLGSQPINGPLVVKALEANTNPVTIGNDGSNDVTLSNGLQLAAGDEVIFDFVGNLSSLWLDATTNGEGVAWLSLNV